MFRLKSLFSNWMFLKWFLLLAAVAIAGTLGYSYYPTLVKPAVQVASDDKHNESKEADGKDKGTESKDAKDKTPPKDVVAKDKDKDVKDKTPPKLTPVEQLIANANAAIKDAKTNRINISVPAGVTDAQLDDVCQRYKKQGWRARKGTGDVGQRYLVLDK